jgi:AcrR family transcriptional regulator
MSSIRPVPVPHQPSVHSAAQLRIVGAALDLFAEHGVGGTSLQMIADAVGVTKAAVYHQFRTKEEIMVAAAETELALVEAAVEAAEAEGSPESARQALVSQIVDLAVARRRMESTFLGDPVIIRFFAHHPPFREVMDRLYRILMGEDPGGDAHGGHRRCRDAPPRRRLRRRDAPCHAPAPRSPLPRHARLSVG